MQKNVIERQLNQKIKFMKSTIKNDLLAALILGTSL